MALRKICSGPSAALVVLLCGLVGAVVAQPTTTGISNTLGNLTFTSRGNLEIVAASVVNTQSPSFFFGTSPTNGFMTANASDVVINAPTITLHGTIKGGSSTVTIAATQTLNLDAPTVTVAGSLAGPSTFQVTAGQQVTVDSPTISIGPGVASSVVVGAGGATVTLGSNRGNITLNADASLALSSQAGISIVSPASTTVLTDTFSVGPPATSPSLSVTLANVVVGAPILKVPGAVDATSALTLASPQTLTLSTPTVVLTGGLSGPSSFPIAASQSLSVDAAQVLVGPSVASSIQIGSGTTSVITLGSSQAGVTLNGNGGDLTLKSTGMNVSSSSFTSVVGPAFYVGPSPTNIVFSANATNVVVSSPSLTVPGVVESSSATLQISASQSISVNSPLTAVAGSLAGPPAFLITASQSITVDSPIVTLGNGATGPNRVSSSNVQVMGTINVMPYGSSTIQVANPLQLINTWNTLKGQPISSLITIQLAPGSYDLSTLNSNSLLIFQDQPYANQIIIQGTVGLPSQATISGGFAFSNVNGITLQFLTFDCTSNSAKYCQWPALLVTSGSNVVANNVNINGNYGATYGGAGVAVFDYENLPSAFFPLVSNMNSAMSTFTIFTTVITGPQTGIGCAGKVSCSVTTGTVTATGSSVYISAGAVMHMTGGTYQTSPYNQYVWSVQAQYDSRLYIDGGTSIFGGSAVGCILVNYFSTLRIGTVTLNGCYAGVSLAYGATCYSAGPFSTQPGGIPLTWAYKLDSASSLWVENQDYSATWCTNKVSAVNSFAQGVLYTSTLPSQNQC